MSTTLSLLEEAPAEDGATAVDWLPALDLRPRRTGARRLAALMLALVIAVVACGAAAVVWFVGEPVQSATLIAPANEGGAALYRSRLEPRRKRVVLTPIGGFDAAAPSHSRQLWMMRAYGPPVSLGLLTPRRTSTLQIDRGLLPPDNPPTHLFVTEEAPGGSGQAYPKGPTIAEAVLAPVAGD